MINHYKDLSAIEQENAQALRLMLIGALFIFGVVALAIIASRVVREVKEQGHYVTVCDESGCYQHDKRV